MIKKSYLKTKIMYCTKQCTYLKMEANECAIFSSFLYQGGNIMSQMMKCVVKERPEVGALALVERPVPTYGANDILIKVKAAAVCGTDVHIMEWNEWSQERINPPTIIGHEFAGEVIAVVIM